MDIDTTLHRIRTGDRHAFAEIVRAYQGPLFGFLGNMGLAQGQVEDLAQETFLRAWRHLDRYDPGLSRFPTWLFTIARRLALNELDRAGHRREQSANDDPWLESACEREQPPETLATAQRRQALHAALRQLPVADRSVLALAYLQELDLAEVARIEGCRPGAVKTRLHRARKRLAQLLEASA